MRCFKAGMQYLYLKFARETFQPPDSLLDIVVHFSAGSGAYLSIGLNRPVCILQRIEGARNIPCALSLLNAVFQGIKQILHLMKLRLFSDGGISKS